jgi:endo-1,4-beta-D-glucanase Y
MRSRWIGIILIVLALVILAGVMYENSHRKVVPLQFSPTAMLNSIWQNYQKEYLEPGDYRTLDRSRDNITTSEGESYTMLRAVWLGDKTTYDEELTWTKDNLQHKTGDHLFAWLFGERADGSYGVLTAQGGNTTASDADSDIALSLIFAYSRWQDPTYVRDARDIVRDIWSQEVITINGVPYLTADNFEKGSASNVVIVNPSYLSPASYRIFAEVDPQDPWNELVNSSYTVIGDSMKMNLDATSTDNLPPDWITINKTTGAIAAYDASENISTSTQSGSTNTGSSATSTASSLTTNFGYDAIRVPFRLALDYEWFQDPRDKQLLDQMTYLSTEYNKNGELAATYTHSGAIAPSYNYEDASMYGATIGYFMISNPKLATTVYNNKLLFLYNPDTNAWKQLLPYYDDNWAWFGIALYNNLLPNLAASVPSSVLGSQ